MRKPSNPIPLFSLRDVSALLELPLSRVARAVSRGVIQADFETRGVKLFRPSHLAKITKQIGGH